MVRVQLHDLVLGVIAFDLQRHYPLVYLARVRLFAREKQVLRKLLCQCRPTFNFVGSEILPGCAGDADRIDADVIVEAHIFDGQDRVLHHRRNLVVLERDALLQGELAN